MTRRTWMTIGLAAIAALAAQPAAASVDNTVAAGPNGTSAFAWTQAAAGESQVHERTRTAGGVLSDAQPLSWAYREAGDQSIGTDAAGNAIVTWRQTSGPPEGVYARRRAADGSLGAVQRLTPVDWTFSYDFAKLAVEPDGDAVVVWMRYGQSATVIQARRRSAAGVLGPIQTLSNTTGTSVRPDVAVTPGGAATVAWTRRISSDEQYFQTRTIAPDGSLSPVQDLTTSRPDRLPVQVTVSDAGTAVFSWRVGGDSSAVESRARTADGTLGPTRVLTTDSFGDLAVAGNGAGRTVFVWCDCNPCCTSQRLMGRIRNANGTLGPEFHVVTGASDSSLYPAVAMDPTGAVWFAYQETNPRSSTVWVRRRSAAGALGMYRHVSDGPRRANDAHIAVDAAGKATVAWYEDGFDLFARTVTAGGTTSIARRINGG